MKRIISIISSPFSLLRKHKFAYFPGLAVMGILLAYTLAFNITLSYMGNSSDQAISMILNNFLLTVIIILVKILLAYVLIGISLNVVIYSGLCGYKRIRGIEPSPGKEFLVISFFILLLVLLRFFESIVVYPQLYTETIYARGGFIAAFQRFLTDNINPAVFSILFYGILIFFAGIAAYSFIKQKRSIFMSAAERLISWKWKVLSPAGVVAAVMVTVLALSHEGPRDTSRPNILILSSDALRQDHFSGNGYFRDTTPNIDLLSKKGMSFGNIYTTVPRTFPAWVSILASRYPMYHGIRHMFPSSSSRNRNFVTLATELRDKGYDTVLAGDFAADIFPRIELGFNRIYSPTFNLDIMIEQLAIKNNSFIVPFLTNRAGFIFFPGIRECAEFADPAFVTDRIKKEISGNVSAGRPFFITGFYSVTHFPYSSPWPYYNRYSGPGYTGPYKYLKNRIIELNTAGGKNSTGAKEISEKEAEQVRALYDGCLRAFDDSVGELSGFLEEKGLTDNTIVIVLSDHGENLYEHELGMGHGEHLRGKLSLNVPFIISWKKLPRGADTAQARSCIDISPTILEIAGFNQPGEFQGRSLLKKNGDSPVYIETGLWFDTGGDYFFQRKRLHYPDITGLSYIESGFRNEIILDRKWENFTWTAKHRAIIDGDYKLIYMPIENGIEYELYNIRKDPEELKDLSGSEAAVLDRMKKKFFAFMEKDSNLVFRNGYIFPVFNDPQL